MSVGKCWVREQLNELFEKFTQVFLQLPISCAPESKTFPGMFPALENTEHTKQYETSNNHKE